MVSSLFTILENHKQKYNTLARDFHEGETPYWAFRSQLVAVSCDCGVGRTMVFSASLFRVLNITLINVMSLDHASGAVLWSHFNLDPSKTGSSFIFCCKIYLEWLSNRRCQ